MMFRTLSDRTTGYGISPQSMPCIPAYRVVGTFIFADVFQRECQARVFPLNDPHLAKCAFAYHSKQAEVVEIDCTEDFA